MTVVKRHMQIGDQVNEELFEFSVVNECSYCLEIQKTHTQDNDCHAWCKNAIYNVSLMLLHL